MAKVILRQKAIDDLNSIWIYTFHKWSENQANKYYQGIENSFLKLGENPNIGKPYSEIDDNLFGLVSGKHIVFYQIVADKEIEVIRILHEQMNIESRLTD